MISTLTRLTWHAAHHAPETVPFLMPTIEILEELGADVRPRLGRIFVKIGRQSYTMRIVREPGRRVVYFYRRGDPKKRPVTPPLNVTEAYAKFRRMRDGYEAYAYKLVRKRVRQLLEDAEEARTEAA